MRALADVAGGEAREPGAVVEQPLEVRDRHELGVGLAVHVDELGEDELDAPLVELGAELVRGEGVVSMAMSPSDSRACVGAAIDRAAGSCAE